MGNAAAPVATTIIRYTSCFDKFQYPDTKKKAGNEHKHRWPAESTINQKQLEARKGKKREKQQKTHHSSNKINKHEKPHRKTTKPNQL
jgi:hypothetical protein